MNNYKVLILAFLMVILTALFSCNKKEAEALDINFSLDNQNLFSLNKDYSEEDLDLYKNDPDKVFYSIVGHPIRIKTTDDVGFLESILWRLNDSEWKDVKNPYDFKYAFKLPGLYKLTMEVNDVSVSKFVRIIENSKPREKHQNNSSQNKKTENIDFTIDNHSPNKWEAILLNDVSSINEKITRRVWDFGDGTVIPTVGSAVKYSYSKPGKYEIKMCLNLTNKCSKKRIIVNDKNELETVGVGITDSNNKKKATQQSSNPSIDNRSVNQEAPNNTSTNTLSKVRKRFNKKNQLKENSNDESNTDQTIDIHEIKFTMPNHGRVGTPIRIKDMSSPAEAIQYRNWYVDGVEQNFHQKSIDMIFDKVGSYKIKMCLNYLSKNCIEKNIEITDKNKRKNPKLSAPVGSFSVPYEKRSPTPEFEPLKELVAPSTGFLCQSYGKSGAILEYKCAQNLDYFNGVSIMRLNPVQDVELHSAKIVGNTNGFVDIIINDVEKSEVAVLKRVQVLSGKTTVEFAEFALTLKQGKEYELALITLPQRSKRQKKLKLLNSANCNVPMYKNETLSVEYQDDVQLLYDIKFCY